MSNARVHVRMAGPMDAANEEKDKEISRKEKIVEAATYRPSAQDIPDFGPEGIIEPRICLRTISELFGMNSTLLSCAECYVNNIVGYGATAVYKNLDPAKDKPNRKQKEEMAILESFLNYANPTQSLRSVRKTVRFYREKYGHAYYEVVRNSEQSFVALYAKKPTRVRKCAVSAEQAIAPVTSKLDRGGTVIEFTVYKPFEKYVEIDKFNNRVYYKEYGDPRVLNRKTGEYVDKGGTIKDIDIATELIHTRTLSEDPYGMPDWLTALLSVLGGREASENAYRHFSGNRIPAGILTVTNGKLTQESYNELNAVLRDGSFGKDARSRLLLLEAYGEAEGIDEKPTPAQVDLKPLNGIGQQDGMFSQYLKDTKDDIRLVYRIPSVLIGMSQDVNYATANTATAVAETQVFVPERLDEDELLNKLIVNNPNGLGLSEVYVQTRGPVMTNPEAIVKTLTAINVMGGVTPRDAVSMVNTLLQLGLQQYPAKGDAGWEEWMDKPIQLALRADKPAHTQAEQSVKTQEQKAIEAGAGAIGLAQPKPGTE